MPTNLAPADAEARQLAAAVGRGDESAFRALYDRFRVRLFRFAIVLGHGDESIAADIVQSTFVTAATSLRHIESEEHLWNWLARVARQHHAKTRRREQSHPPSAGLEELSNQFTREPDSVLEQGLATALEALDADERQLIEWFYFDGLTQKELAERLAATPKAISSRLERARSRLRQFLTRALSRDHP